MIDTPLRLIPGNPTWPSAFDEVPNAPKELWLRGSPDVLTNPRRIAIVGSRSASGYGLDQAGHFAFSLAQAGFTVVSGLARGVDQAAHLGALDAGGTTIAILGNGVDKPWPNFHELPRLLQDGLLLSEYPPGQAPRRHHFPLRNRLIAAMADAVLVIEAAHASGSLITAHWALEIGREVFALPGRVDHPMAAGTLRLLREGARAVGSPAQLLEDLDWQIHPGPGELPKAGGRSNTESDLCATSLAILQALEGQTLSTDELAETLEVPVPELLARLAQLHLGGLVARGPGGLYRRPPGRERDP